MREAARLRREAQRQQLESRPMSVEVRFVWDLSVYPRDRAMRLLGLVRSLRRQGGEDIDVVVGNPDDPDYFCEADLEAQAAG